MRVVPGLLVADDELLTCLRSYAQVDVDAVLSDRLGDPEEGEQGILCSREGSPWSEIVNYGELVVFYTAEDQSEMSSRSLAAWGMRERSPATCR